MAHYGKASPDDRPDSASSALRRRVPIPHAAVLLLDVVLGYGAHPDPACGSLPPSPRDARGPGPEAATSPLSFSLLRRSDPQGRDATAKAGSRPRVPRPSVLDAAAARTAVGLLKRAGR